MSDDGKLKNPDIKNPDITNFLILEKLNYLDDCITKLKQSLSDRTNDISNLVEQLKRVQKIAEEAKMLSSEIASNTQSVYDSMKTHISRLDEKILSFKHLLHEVSEENKVQTNTLNTLAASEIERVKNNKEFEVNIDKKIDSQTLVLHTLVDSDRQRQLRDVAEKAVKDVEEKKLETFWKRLPVWISICVVGAGLLVWIMNSLMIASGKK